MATTSSRLRHPQVIAMELTPPDSPHAPRPLIGMTLPELESRVSEFWENPAELIVVARELGYRKRPSAMRSSERVAERIKELGGEVPPLPNGSPSGTEPALHARIAELEAQVAQLQEQLAAKKQALHALQKGGLFSQPG